MEGCHSSLVLAVHFPGGSRKYHKRSKPVSPISIKAAMLHPQVNGELNDEEVRGWEDKM